MPYFSRYSILFGMETTQPVTALRIITFQKSLKNTQNITLK